MLGYPAAEGDIGTSDTDHDRPPQRCHPQKLDARSRDEPDLTQQRSGSPFSLAVGELPYLTYLERCQGNRVWEALGIDIPAGEIRIDGTGSGTAPRPAGATPVSAEPSAPGGVIRDPLLRGISFFVCAECLGQTFTWTCVDLVYI